MGRRLGHRRRRIALPRPPEEAAGRVHGPRQLVRRLRPFGDGTGTPESNRFCSDIDHDGDGFSADDGDCLDSDSTVYPGGDELFDGLDNDCNGTTDDLSDTDATSWLDGVETDYLGWDTSLSVADFDGDGTAELVVGGALVNSGYRGGVFVLDASDASTWAGDINDYEDVRIDAAGTYTYWGTMGQTQGDVDGDGTPRPAGGRNGRLRFWRHRGIVVQRCQPRRRHRSEAAITFSEVCRTTATPRPQATQISTETDRQTS